MGSLAQATIKNIAIPLALEAMFCLAKEINEPMG